jgi:hypothetical protein
VAAAPRAPADEYEGQSLCRTRWVNTHGQNLEIPAHLDHAGRGDAEFIARRAALRKPGRFGMHDILLRRGDGGTGQGGGTTA